MKVFISWSGEVSQKVALILRDWLPSVIQSIDPYVSSEDIDKGARWSTDIAEELEESSYGIICVTTENFGAAWLNFEAGALSKSIDKSRVSPLLFGIKRSEISGPMLQFQSTISERVDIQKLLHSINSACEPAPLEETRLDSVFDVWWPHLEEKLKQLEADTPMRQGSNDAMASGTHADDILEEVLELLRSQQRLLNSPDELLPPRYIQEQFGHLDMGRYSPSALEDLRVRMADFELMLESRPSDDHIPASEVRSRFRELARPINFIFRMQNNRGRNLSRADREDPE